MLEALLRIELRSAGYKAAIITIILKRHNVWTWMDSNHRLQSCKDYRLNHWLTDPLCSCNNKITSLLVKSTIYYLTNITSNLVNLVLSTIRGKLRCRSPYDWLRTTSFQD